MGARLLLSRTKSRWHDDTSGFSLLLFSLHSFAKTVLPVFGDVLKFARKCSTQLIQGLCFDIFISSKPSQCLAVNPAALPKLVSGYATLLHCYP